MAANKKSSNPFFFIFIALLPVFLLFSPSDSNAPPAATKPPIPHVVTSTATPTEAPTATPTATPTVTPTLAPTSTPEPSPTNSPAPTAEETVAFAVEHDEEYWATQDYIYAFLTEKGYEVQTIIGVPNIGRYEDDDPQDLTVPWYAYVKHKGEWTEFVVLLFNGEVSHIRPIQ